MSKKTGKLFLGFDCAISISSKKRIAEKMKKLYLKIEPHPIKEQDFTFLNHFANEIEKTGIEITVDK